MKRERISPSMVCAVLNEIGKAKAAGTELEPFIVEWIRGWHRYLRLTTVRL